MTDPLPKIRPVDDKRAEDCVKVLTAALEHAKAGEYSSVVVCAESVADDSMYWSYSPCKETFVELLGKLDVLKWKIYHRMSETTEGVPR